MDSLSENNTNKLNNTGKQEVGLSGSGREGLTVSAAERVFQQIDGPFDKDTVAVKIFPMIGAARDAWIEPEIFAWIGVNTSAIS